MMNIPTFLRSVLEADRALMGGVELSIRAFLPVLPAGPLDFFPEYTDHGPDHLAGVLNAASSLISDEARELLSAADVTVLVLAVLLHDAGMHLTVDTFEPLLSSDRRIQALDQASWKQLWDDYLDEVRRFDGRTLTRLFGDTTPLPAIEVRRDQMTRRDRLAIGEFLRRHHHRLAHEIAVFGFPTISDQSLRLHDIPGDIADLSGLVARSHGVTLRSLLSYLKTSYDLRTYKHVHTVFLMGVLRVADYIQVQAERAPRQMLAVRRLASPVSKGEWAAHAAVRDIRHVHEDPEALFIDARPPDVRGFFKVKDWIDGIQGELDSTWAVFGEVYGRFGQLNRLGLTLRRVRSNLEEPSSLEGSIDYIPVRAAFESADPDLLKLLVAPLYGDKPELGIRELTQNALDAVRERAFVDGTFVLSEDDVNIALDVSQTPARLTIRDRGIGMTEGVVTNYFLRAGASFRRSDAWRRTFEDSIGRSTVLRSGRFGVGVLAAFLLGDTVIVCTRHAKAKPQDGIKFTATLDSEIIQLDRCDADIGTMISIVLRDDALRQLARIGYGPYWRPHSVWDFHCLSQPGVRRTLISGETYKLEQRHTLPMSAAKLPQGWRRIAHPDYEEIQWTYHTAPALVCNGILVQEDPAQDSYVLQADGVSGVSLRTPNVSVFDPNGNLPLTLQRDRLVTRTLPFSEELADDASKDCIADALQRDVQRPEDFKLTYGRLSRTYRGLSIPKGDIQIDAWAYGARGYTLSTSWNLHNAGSLRPMVAAKVWYGRNAALPISDEHLLIRAHAQGGATGLAKWLRFVLRAPSIRPQNRYPALTQLSVAGSRVIVPGALFTEAIEANRLPKYLTRALRVETTTDRNLVVIAVGECSADATELLKWESLIELETPGHPPSGLFSITEWFLNQGECLPGDGLSRAWDVLIGPRLLPHDPIRRRTECASAFTALESYMETQVPDEPELEMLEMFGSEPSSPES